MENDASRLIVTHGPNLGHEYFLQGNEATIGRSTVNSIVLPSPEISRRHAHLWTEGESIFLEDLGSTNGTFVNNARLYNQVELYDGDEIQIGDAFRLLFTSPGGVTRPIPTGLEKEVLDPQPGAASSDLSAPYSTSEIPTPTPPLFTIPGEPEGVVELPENNAQERPTIFWIAGAALLIMVLCLLTFLFLDSYDQGRLLYCGSLQSLFRFLLGPFGFNPVC